ncbi:hypothetical protein PanWU01x14_156720 [Parasponia andersonii]|uniref:Uncharacterized protein n=1 Tax=Parasponia andersonii TaxID=3476 RepID=A0A2P5CFX7_PARAD|nr:hypothetical protein PanWU01x14_156720 [Parasponia andersonii]
MERGAGKQHLGDADEKLYYIKRRTSMWRYKSRTSQLGLLGFASPRNTRRSNRLLDMEVKEEKDLGLVEDVGKSRKSHHIARNKRSQHENHRRRPDYISSHDHRNLDGDGHEIH